MVVSDAYEHIRMVNTQTERLFGLNREELIGKPVSLLLPRGKNACAVRSDGKTFPMEVISSQLKSQDGPLTISVIRDITERRNAEERDRRANAELEEKVIERTTELRRSNEELRQFAYVASHDLKEPLRMVSNYTQLLDRSCQDSLGKEAEQYIGYILQGVNRMHGLIEDLLSYSEIDSRNTFFKTVDSGAALREALANLQVPIAESGAVITASTMPATTGDHIQLVRVFQNLIGNSIKYRSEEIPRIQISAERKDDEWEFSVRDNGIGIEPRYKESVFKLFKRLHARSEYPGNGVGLASCRKIIERHGGKIWLKSEAGTGATFCFTLPAAND
jgi:light-regulated signal transduction histidine kinase (bacteriophytochrome)